jgi:hypothetical protein
MIALAVLALPLFAEEPKKPAQPVPDSPLVAAAKRANRLGRKPASKIVITNATLESSGANAHVTTTEKLGSVTLPPPPPPPVEVVLAQQAAERRKIAAEAEAKKQKTAEQRKAIIRAASQANEEEFPDDVDPALAEKALQDAHQQPPPGEKPPR